MRILQFCVIAALGLLSLGAPVHGATVTYNDFSDIADLTINGHAAAMTTSDGPIIRLTSTFNDQHGSFFSSEQVNAADFSTYFQFRISSPGGTLLTDGNTEFGADGIVFVVQSVSSSIGGAGGGIGYIGIDNSVGVEFDTWQNTLFHDPGSNHLGIVTQGDLDHGVGAPYAIATTPNWDNSEIWHAWVDYDGTTLEVRANMTGDRPEDALLTRVIDIPAELGNVSDAFVGFTSGTGYDWGNHDILAWEYRTQFDPIGVEAEAVPEPGSLLAVLAGMAIAAVLRRRRFAVKP